MEKIILPSGNVIPALCEQALYLELRYGIGQGPRFYRDWSAKRYNFVRRLRKWDISTSGESTFIQHGIAPKILSQKDLNRKAWREEIQLNRDRNKSRHTYGTRKKWACNVQNRWERRAVKQHLRNQNYDQIFTRPEPRDTWLWD